MLIVNKTHYLFKFITMIEDNQSYLNDLNDAQLNAVIKTEGPSMVIAELDQVKLEF